MNKDIIYYGENTYHFNENKMILEADGAINFDADNFQSLLDSSNGINIIEQRCKENNTVNNSNNNNTNANEELAILKKQVVNLEEQIAALQQTAKKQPTEDSDSDIDNKLLKERK